VTHEDWQFTRGKAMSYQSLNVGISKQLASTHRHTSNVADEMCVCAHLPHGLAWLEDGCRKLQGKVINIRGSEHQPMTIHTHMHLPYGLAQLEGECRKLGKVVDVRGVKHE